MQRGDLIAVQDEIVRRFEAGEILIPQVPIDQPVFAGGTNHFPNSDLSYSTLAATVAGTLPATAGDLNFEAWRLYWAERDADVVLDAEHALKSVDHSLYAANEGVNTGIPVWDRENGWIVYGAEGATQYDIIAVPLGNIVGASERWFPRFRIVALDATLIPDGVEFFGGFWIKTAAGEGYITGSTFDLDYEIKGTPGAVNANYRVLAKTDSGVSILSSVLNVPDHPTVLSTAHYVKLYHNAGPGWIEYLIYKEFAGVYKHIYSVRNSSDLQYNDVGVVAFPAEILAGWPVVTEDAPTAYAETGRSRTLLIGAYLSPWQGNNLHIKVPDAYDYSQTEDVYYRFGLTEATGVDRHVGIDKLWLSTTSNEWAPDKMAPFPDGTYPIPSISPTSGNQGGGTGILPPPDPGSGGGDCVLVKTPVITMARGRRVLKQYQSIKIGGEIRGEERLPYLVIGKKTGVVSEYYEITTQNGITLGCSVNHELARSVNPRRRIKARHVEAGTKLACEVKGRKAYTTVTSKQIIPRPAEVGSFSLRHLGGLHKDGDGMYLAGESQTKDRGLFCFNIKNFNNP